MQSYFFDSYLCFQSLLDSSIISGSTFLQEQYFFAAAGMVFFQEHGKMYNNYSSVLLRSIGFQNLQQGIPVYHDH